MFHHRHLPPTSQLSSIKFSNISSVVRCLDSCIVVNCVEMSGGRCVSMCGECVKVCGECERGKKICEGRVILPVLPPSLPAASCLHPYSNTFSVI